jgi:ADP-ribosylation factor GTPase-activating protein 2/3
MLSDGSSLAGLEAGARDAVARVLANPDVQNVGYSIRDGALKVSGLLFLVFFFTWRRFAERSPE